MVSLLSLPNLGSNMQPNFSNIGGEPNHPLAIKAIMVNTDNTEKRTAHAAPSETLNSIDTLLLDDCIMRKNVCEVNVKLMFHNFIFISFLFLSTCNMRKNSPT